MLGENISGGNLCNLLRSQFAYYSKLTDRIPPGHDKDKRHNEMLYGNDCVVGDHVNDSLDANLPLDDTVQFPVHCEAGKVVTSYPYQKPRDSGYKILQPFQKAMNYKLAHFFCSARVLISHVDEFFGNGFLSAGLDTFRTTFSYYLAYTL